MKSTTVWLPVLLVLALAACGGGNDTAAPSIVPAIESEGVLEDAATAPETTEDAVAPVDETVPESATAAESDTPAPPQPAAQGRTPQGPEPVTGRDYLEISNPQPYAPLNGQIEVVEIFGYTCPACAAFEPYLQIWKRQLPADVRFTPVPAAFGGFWDEYARAYYAAQALGVAEASHQAVFDAVHRTRALPPQGTTPQQLGEFYAQFGVDADRFASTLQSFGLQARLNQARQFATRAGVTGTPAIVINGKYNVPLQGNLEELLRVTDHLIARERAAQP